MKVNNKYDFMNSGIYPFLLGVYPIIFFFAQNVQEASITEAIIPLIISLTASILLVILLKLFFISIDKAMLAASIILVLSFLYGHVVLIFEKYFREINLHNHLQLLITILLVLGYILYFIKTASFDFFMLRKPLNIILIILLSMNLFQIGCYYINYSLSLIKNNDEIIDNLDYKTINTKSNSIKNLPDIYLLVLDEFASSGTIKDLFGYKNDNFELFLKQKGFMIPVVENRTYSNATSQVIASLFNMKKIYTRDENELEDKIVNNKLMPILKENGYKIICFPYKSRYNFNNADIIYPPNSINDTYNKLSDFNFNFLKTTVLMPVIITYFQGDSVVDIKPAYVNFILQKLMQIPDMKDLKFIYAHITCPHVPFSFDENGNIIGVFDKDGDKYYLGEYKYITKKMKIVTKNIIEKSKNPPIIIITSDHGPRGKTGHTVGTKKEHWENIFTAYHFPEEFKSINKNSMMRHEEIFNSILSVIRGK